jgi:L-ascorbate metabolism protein UlaG (beta-lactamase superfamily)
MRRGFWIGGIVALVTAAGGVVLSRQAAFGGRPEGARRARMERSPQWKDGRFVNPQPIRNRMGVMARDLLDASDHRTPSSPVPTVPVDPARLARPPASGLRITWLGHSTLLVELEGRRLLVDPVWSERASPFGALGPRRYYPPLIALADLPPVDAVLISHDHYDHLDLATIAAMRGWETTFIVPLGVGAHLEAWGIRPDRIVELDWWERTHLGGLEVVATPGRHASGRALLGGRDRTLWAGFALLGTSHRVYCSGDTGLFPGLSEVGARLGPFDAALIEAGAYGRAWPDWHLGPEQAVQAAGMVRARLLIPIHWGLFTLAYHGWTEPAERSLAAARRAGQPLALPRPGESLEPATAPTDPGLVARWWPALPWRSAEQDPIVSTWAGGAAAGLGAGAGAP